jgi:four helix bundle protein
MVNMSLVSYCEVELLQRLIMLRRSAESSNDFIHKLKIALKELNETAVWLEIIIRSKMVTLEKCVELQKECDELCRIMGASVKTSQKRRKK